MVAVCLWTIFLHVGVFAITLHLILPVLFGEWDHKLIWFLVLDILILEFLALLYKILPFKPQSVVFSWMEKVSLFYIILSRTRHKSSKVSTSLVSEDCYKKTTFLAVFLALAVSIVPARATPTDACQKSLGSVYDDRNQWVVVTGTQFLGMSSVEPCTVMIVPPDKKFVLTDIIATPVSSDNFCIWFLENKIPKTIMVFSSKQHIQKRLHLNSEIPFAPGSSVALQRKGTEGGGCVTFSGYLIDTK